MYVEYTSNNSGGRWWLKDEDWKALEKAGWKVVWADKAYLYDDSGNHRYDADGMPILIPLDESCGILAKLVNKDAHGVPRYLGALAKTAFRAGLTLKEAVAEWERITSGDPCSTGCPCCGQPHRFTEYDDNGKYVDSGPNVHTSASFD